MADLGFLARFKRFSGSGLLYAGIIFFIMTFSGCATSTTFRVLDAETKKPIEGAVALAEWTKDYGLPGLSDVRSAKLAEDVSDSEGYLTIPGTIGTLVLQTPLIQIYKAGYVGWNSRRIYLGYRGSDIKRLRAKKRTDFTMKDQDIYLEPWKEEYSYISHAKFISTGADIIEGSEQSDAKYREAIHSEIPLARKEWDELNELNVKNSMKLNRKRK